MHHRLDLFYIAPLYGEVFPEIDKEWQQQMEQMENNDETRQMYYSNMNEYTQPKIRQKDIRRGDKEDKIAGNRF